MNLSTLSDPKEPKGYTLANVNNLFKKKIIKINQDSSLHLPITGWVLYQVELYKIHFRQLMATYRRFRKIRKIDGP